jgi:hypothetical protein
MEAHADGCSDIHLQLKLCNALHRANTAVLQIKATGALLAGQRTL